MKQVFTPARIAGCRFVVVSLFSGMGGLDTGLARSGMTIAFANDANFNACLMHMANFKHDDGIPTMTPFIEIDEETYKSIKADKDTQDYCGIIDGKYYRTRLVQEIKGQEIRETVERRYGKNVIIVLSSGAPCQEMSLMSSKARKGKTNPSGKNSKHLVLEFSRIASELQPDVICAEEVPELKLPQNRDVYDKMMLELNAMSYNIIENELCSCHYGGAQIRWRHFMLAIHAKYKAMPVFPTADTNSAKRVKDVLPYVKYFSSEQFTDKIKTSNYVLCTITRGTPALFWDSQGRKWTPTLMELMKFVGFDEDHIIPEGVTDSQVRLAVGNTVCTYAAEAIGRSLIKSITDTLSSGDGQIPPEDVGPDDQSGSIRGGRTYSSESNEVSNINQADIGTALTPDRGGGDGSQIELLKSPMNQGVPAELIGANDFRLNVVRKVSSEVHPLMLQYRPYEEEDNADEPRVEVIYNGSKIINSFDLLKMDFETLPFAGEWLDFLGEPSSCFHMAVFGKAGQGKSSFSIQVANYLANSFGNAIYVSGEEGFCLTFQKKFRDYGAASPHLDVADVRTYPELLRSIEPGQYRFILLDSIDTLKISAEQLRELKQRYKDSAFITISQVTKSGDARGSYQVMHDADIIVEVCEGRAFTIKNRFQATGRLYSVFK